MCLWQVSLVVDSGSLTGCLSMTFAGATNSNVADSFGSAYLGPFMWFMGMDAISILSYNINDNINARSFS